MSNETENTVDVINSFEDLNINRNTLRGIFGVGFEKPSPIQSKAIPLMIKRKDIIAQAQSGTGKTGCFIIGSLALLNDNNDPNILVLSPTRELALQTTDVYKSVSQFYLNDNEILSLVGGTKTINDKIALTKKNKIIVGTPGKVFDMINRGFLVTQELSLLILDEADELFDQGFSDQILNIFKFMPKNIQMCLFSATMPPEILSTIKPILRDPHIISVKNEALTLDGIAQFYVAVDDEYKMETLSELYNSVSISQSIIFCNTKKKAIWLSSSMEKKDHTVSLIHSELAKYDRNKIVNRFKEGHTRVLISTDLLSRGLDAQHVSIVINFDIPYNKECYIHRIGRSGRYGRKGLAINFVTPKDVPKLKELQEFYQTEIKELPMDFMDSLS